jgi:hypothetical protein
MVLVFFFVALANVFGICWFGMLLVTLKGRMPEGVICICYEGWVVFHCALHPLESYRLTTRPRVCDWWDDEDY